MFAPRRIVILSTVVALLSALVVGAANAEPKNQWPFTRPATSRILTQAASDGVVDATPMPEPKNELPFTRIVGGRGLSGAGANGVVDATPVPEPKNELPFTRIVGGRGLSGAGANGVVDATPVPEPKNELPFTRIVGGRGLSAGTGPLSSSGGDGTDWPLIGWGSLVVITLVAGVLVLRHGAWFSARNYPA